jgi:hypothetical protein
VAKENLPNLRERKNSRKFEKFVAKKHPQKTKSFYIFEIRIIFALFAK